MFRKVFILFLLITFFIAYPKSAFAGAWTVPKGHLYIESYNKYYCAEYDFNADKKKVRKSNNGKYEEYYTEVKLEFGVTDDLNILAYLPYKEVRYKDDNGKSENSGLGDMWLRTKFRFTQEPFTSSAMLGVKFPMGYDDNESLALGTEQIDGEAKILIGKNFTNFPSYLGVELGYRARAEERTNEIPYFFEFGFQPTDKIMIKTVLDGIEGLSGTGKIEEDYTKWTLSLIYKLKGGFSSVYRGEPSINLEIGYGKTFRGKNSSSAKEIFANLSTQF